jgi:YegS/Rv2252/BmrU family lipid kinase
MEMFTQYARAIVNPAAGGRSIYREWPRVRKHLIEKGLSFDYVYTEGVGHAIELARAAANGDYRYIIAVGGDGTVNEVVNGILDSAGSHNTILGIVSAGTTCSFARSIGVPLDPLSSCNLLISQNRLPIDVGLVEYKNEDRHLRRFFVNEVDVGFGATLVKASKLMPSYFGRKVNYLPYFLGGVGTLLKYKNKRIALRVEEEAEEICVCTMVVIANGAYFGGGMCIAPDAKPNDGLLDMVIFGDMAKSEIMKIWTMTYEGRHVSHDKVKLRRMRKVTIQCSEQVFVEADGEFLGEGPLSFSVLPSALSIVV